MKIGLYKLSSCSGCILELLTILSRKPDLLNKIELYTPLLSKPVICDKYDAVFIEGSVSEDNHVDLVKELRGKSKYLITIGVCSIQGGLQNNSIELNKPVSSVVKVDYAIPGCPVDSSQLMNTLLKIIHGGLDIRYSEPLCVECKRNNTVCVLVQYRKPCLGPLTRSGCGAICPIIGRGCIGCSGLREDISSREIELIREKLVELGLPETDFYKYIGLHKGVPG